MPKIKKLLAAVPGTHGHAVIVGNTDPEQVKEALQEIGFFEVSIMPASPSLFAEEPNKTKTARTRRILQALEQETEDWLSLVKSRNSEALKILKTRSRLYQGLTSDMVGQMPAEKMEHLLIVCIKGTDQHFFATAGRPFIELHAFIQTRFTRLYCKKSLFHYGSNQNYAEHQASHCHKR